ncbi:MAG TPA: L-histidine N(alpha)-methyltransferase [Methylomirabilota bacterium]
MRYRVEVHADAHTRLKAMAEDVLRGLGERPRSLPPKYFYDAAGSRLFDEITRLPEYYLTRVEEGLLDTVAPRLMRALMPRDVVELGSGFSLKTRRLLQARGGGPLRYTPVDVDETTVAVSAQRLLAEDPVLEVHAVIGDFERHLVHVPPPSGRRLVLFLGSTIGNLDAPARRALLAQVRGLLRRGDRLLLGVDLVKDPAVLEAAYNDAAGVTAEFNRNILRVVNDSLGADFRPEAFRHHAWYNAAESRIEMHLVPDQPQTVRVRSLDLTVRLEPPETIWTESSYKFTRASVDAMLRAAGLKLDAWHTDADERFALAVAAPMPRAAARAA